MDAPEMYLLIFVSFSCNMEIRSPRGHEVPPKIRWNTAEMIYSTSCVALQKSVVLSGIVRLAQVGLPKYCVQASKRTTKTHPLR